MSPQVDTTTQDSFQGGSLRVDDVHVWHVDLESDQAVVEALTKLLSEDERGRAARFRFERHRRRFVVRRAALRALLGRYTDSPASALRFLYSPRGKPELSGCTNSDAIHFSSSHSHELCIIAVTETGPIGVDIEYLRPIPEADDIARRHFSEAELRDLMDVAPLDHQRAFFNCWTRKEAYVKAVGDGLSIPLDSFDVTLMPGDPPRMLADRLGGGMSVWSLFDLKLAAGYVAALALEHPAPRISVQPVNFSLEGSELI
ncbi:MAG: 4'-phosphopantetheinyl transferase superfamily protein [Gammaproteobacteria bacterium]|nr:4'-phosphopantetheinyl transferase superfamily protein [Gammaproteobacteria bacterium]